VSKVKHTTGSNPRYLIGRFQHSVSGGIQRVEDQSGFLEEIVMNRFAAIGVLAVLTALTIPVTAQQKAAPPALEIQALSTRPEMVTGGDVLLQITGPANLSSKPLTVRVNGKDVSSAFKPASGAVATARDSKTLVGLVSGLNVGSNAIVAAMHGS